MAAGQGFKTFTTGEVLTAGDVNGYLMQGVLVFASAVARDAAITAPSEGQFAFTKDTNGLWYYDGAAWVASGATGDIEGVTAGVGISGGGTSGTVTVTNSMATAIDAKGDLVPGTGADTFSRLAVGADTTVLTADSSTATGLKWNAAGMSNPLTTTGDTIYSSSGTTPARLGIGSTGQVLTVSGGLPAWAPPSSGGMTLLSTTSFSGTSTTISSINQSYIMLVVVIENWYKSSSGDWPAMQWNSQTGANYASSSFSQNTTTGGLNGQTGQTLCRISPNNFDTSATGSNIVITFPNYSASVPQLPYWVCQTSPNANYGTMGFGTYTDTGNKAALTSLTLRSGTLSNNNNGTIKIYGVK